MLDTPALHQLPALQREAQALQFLRASGPQLSGIFSSLGLDVSRGWQEPAARVARAIKAESDKSLRADLDACIDTRIGLSFFPALAAGRQAPSGLLGELRALLLKAAAHPAARFALEGSLSAARADLIDKYIPQAWERKKYIYVEITRVQRLNLPPEAVADLARFALVMRPAAYLFITPGEQPEKDAGFAPLQESYVQKILPNVAALLRSVPQSLIGMGLRSTLAFPLVPNVEAISRLSAILALRGRSMAPGLVVDRGADTPDKSWFNVNRKNARWHALDSRMLDELYTIAAENGW
jgi:hypothetical protein